MPVDAIGQVGSATTDALQNSGISQEAFLKILLTQLRFQDPLKPMNNEEFVAQLAQFSALEINRQQSEKIDSLLSIQATNQSVALIGKQVGLRGAREGETGVVIAIEFQTGEPRLTIRKDGTEDYIREVRLSEIALVADLATN